jgi:hypothetical protein
MATGDFNTARELGFRRLCGTENMQDPRVLTCTKIHAGIDKQFLTVTKPEDSATQN